MGGNLGVGVASPAQALEVSGNVQVGTANLFVDTTTGRVGVGTNTPTQALDVSGNVQVGTANLFVDTTTGNVGIGTSTPVAPLHINSTDSIVLPSGTTAQRNQTPAIGMLRYNSETGYLEAYTAAGWGSIATPPTLTSFSPSVVTPATSNGTDLTINGGFFDENTTVQLRAQNGTLYSTTNLVFTNSGLITVTLGSLTADVYTVVVTRGVGPSVDSTSTFVVNNPPVWSSPAAGVTLNFFTNSSSTTTLSATDPDGGTITYSLVSGTLPSGLTLSGSTITGTSGASDGTLTPITIRASDGIGFVDRSFTIETLAPLYSFSSHTFTNAGATGRYGPTLTQLRNVYNVTWDGDTSLFNVVTQGFQEWTVPATGTYQIQAAGARGGSKNTTSGGAGAVITFNVNLNKSEIISIVVGQSGIDATTSSSDGASGGGGSFIWYKSNLTLIGAAGGGGGIGGSTSTLNKDAFITDSIPDDGSNANPGGQNGTGGDRTGHPANWGGGGGGGWLTAGLGPPENPQSRDNSPSGGYHGYGGKSRTGGFVGGDTNSLGHVAHTRYGGFGGGGGGTAAEGAGGGGGGYSGGYGGGTPSGQIPGSGGSSYSITSLISSSVSNFNHGFVKISKI